MRPHVLLAIAAPSLAIAAPAPNNLEFGYFNITKFSYKCSDPKAPCTWDFYATSGPSFQHHPAITEQLHCTGNTTETEFTPGSCTDPKSSKYLHINGYVATQKASGTRLYMQYVQVPKTRKGFFWYFVGNATVSDNSTQPEAFQVQGSSAAAST